MTTSLVRYFKLGIPDDVPRNHVPPYKDLHATQEEALEEAARLASIWPLRAPDFTPDYLPGTYTRLDSDTRVQTRIVESEREVIRDAVYVRCSAPVEYRLMQKVTERKTVTVDGQEYTRENVSEVETSPWTPIPNRDRYGRPMASFATAGACFYVDVKTLFINGVVTVEVMDSAPLKED